jgi:hypothetical protein
LGDVTEFSPKGGAERAPVTHQVELSATVQAEGKGLDGMSVDRGLNDIRLAVLGVLVTIGLSVGFGVSGPWWQRAAWGLGTFAVACLLVRWGSSRNLLMAFMHRLTTH